jgi:hypothetical protein
LFIAAIMLARLFLKKGRRRFPTAVGGGGYSGYVFPFSLESALCLIPFKAAPIPSDIAMQRYHASTAGST